MDDLNEFRKSLEFTLKWEGGFVDDPDDPGGVTKWGISQRSHPNIGIRDLTAEDAAAIYSHDYWDACGCDEVPFPLNTVLFDSAVNCGVSRARRWLREATTCKEYIEIRKQHYHSIIGKNPSLGKYLKGWLNRVGDLEKFVSVHTPV